MTNDIIFCIFSELKDKSPPKVLKQQVPKTVPSKHRHKLQKSCEESQKRNVPKDEMSPKSGVAETEENTNKQVEAPNIPTRTQDIKLEKSHPVLPPQKRARLQGPTLPSSLTVPKEDVKGSQKRVSD